MIEKKTRRQYEYHQRQRQQIAPVPLQQHHHHRTSLTKTFSCWWMTPLVVLLLCQCSDIASKAFGGFGFGCGFANGFFTPSTVTRSRSIPSWRRTDSLFRSTSSSSQGSSKSIPTSTPTPIPSDIKIDEDMLPNLSENENENKNNIKDKDNKPDNRPHEQRVTKQRKARRMNHSFMHLYRHDNAQFDDTKIALSSKSLTNATIYLMEYGNLKKEQIQIMSSSFPPLLELDVKRHLRPKLRFLKYTLSMGHYGHDDSYSDGNNDSKSGVDANANANANAELDISTILSSIIPPQYFGARLEKVIAPRHAFLISQGLPHGSILLQNNGELFQEFLISCRRTKTFCVLCNTWRKKYGRMFADVDYEHILNSSGSQSETKMMGRGDDENELNINNDNGAGNLLITPQQVDAFDSLFTR
jgi:hypothetical protein